MAQLAFTDLLGLDAAQRGHVRAIYEQAFPVRQREAFDSLLEAAREGDGLTLVATEAGEVVAFAALSRLKRVACSFLEYYAVLEGRRGGGLGRLLWAELLRYLDRSGESARLVFEVEDPAEADADPEEQHTRRRRIRFYERLGAVILPVHDYVVPNLDGTGTERMLLMWADAGGDEAGPPRADLRELVRGLYTEGYELPEDDPLVLRALDGLACGG